MRYGRAAFACVCALVALAVLGSGVATASVKPKKKIVAANTTAKTPAATKTKSEPMCQLGQATVVTGSNKVPLKCTPNPLFSKDFCSDYLPQVQALDPGATIATAGNRYGPPLNVVDCYYTANGKTQSFFFTVSGGANWHGASMVDPSKQVDLEQSFEEEYQQWVQGTNQCDPQPPGAVKTTLEGFEAFTFDDCPSTSNGVVRPAGGRVEVLAGDTWIIVGASWTFDVNSSSQLIPFAEQLIAKYH